MTISLFLVMLYRLQESLALVHYLSVLDRDHLVEVDGLSLVDTLGLLVTEPDLPRPKRLKMIPGTELIVQHFKLVLNLRIVAPWSWHVVSWYWVVSLNGIGERVLHWYLRKRHARSDRLQYHGSLLFAVWIALVLIGRWAKLVSGVSEWHDGDVSADQISSFGICSEIWLDSLDSTYHHFVQRLLWVVCSWTWIVKQVFGWMQRVSFYHRFKRTISLVNSKWLHHLKGRRCCVWWLVIFRACFRVSRIWIWWLENLAKIVFHLLLHRTRNRIWRSPFFNYGVSRLSSGFDRIVIRRPNLMLASYTEQIWISNSLSWRHKLWFFSIIGTQDKFASLSRWRCASSLLIQDFVIELDFVLEVLLFAI